MGLPRRFFGLNFRLSAAVAHQWPHTRYDVFREYASTIATLIESGEVRRVVDVGAGTRLPYEAAIAGTGACVTGVDISAEDMDRNEFLSDRRVVNVVSEPLPFGNGEIDLVASSSVLEHLRDIDPVLGEAARVLRPGGYLVNVFPSRYAMFALLNRVLPHRLSRRFLYYLHPHVVGLQGFEAFYDRCYASAYCRLLRQHGFEILAIRPCYYGSSYYFSVFFPAYLAGFAWELAAWATRNPDLCATLLVVARRPAGSGTTADASGREAVAALSEP